MALSEAKARANKKYDDAHYERISIKFPKGTKERIKNLPIETSINGFVVRAVEKLIEEESI